MIVFPALPVPVFTAALRPPAALWPPVEGRVRQNDDK